jgi:mRNA interferase RelE/StbE
MSYIVRIDRAAEKEIRKLDNKIRRRILDALHDLGVDPLRSGVKKLTDSDDYYRYRVGDYRILFTIKGKQLVVRVVGVRHRGKAYKA